MPSSEKNLIYSKEIRALRQLPKNVSWKNGWSMLAQCQQNNFYLNLASSTAHYCNAIAHLLKLFPRIAFSLHLRNDNNPRWLQVPGQRWRNGTQSINAIPLPSTHLQKTFPRMPLRLVPGQLWHNGTRSISSGNGRTGLCRDFRTRRRRVKGTPGNKWVYSRRLLLRMRRKTFRLKDAAHNDKDGGHDDDIEDGNDHQNPWRHNELCALAGFPNTNAIADQQGQRQAFWNLLNTKF